MTCNEIPARVLLMLATALLGAQAARAQVSGSVVDATTMAPVPGAIVSLQATTERDTAAADGTFDLPGASGSGLTIVAAQKGYYNNSVVVNAPTSGVLILLVAVPQSDDPAYSFIDPTTCAWCHPDQYAQWNGSDMARAGVNTWVYDIYDGTGSPGGMGGFVYTRDSVHKDHNPASECASCHQPEPWIASPYSALEDLSNLSTGALHGVSCEVCHKIAHLDRTKVDYPGIWPGVVTFTRPTPSDGPVEYGVLGDSNFTMMPYMRPSYQPQLTAVMCAACHQDKNDPDEDGVFDEPGGVISEPTYLEWLASPYADPNSPLAATCVDCHMPPYGANTASSHQGTPIRDPDTIRHHHIEGTNAEFLENAVTLDLDLRDAGGVLEVRVHIANDKTGHHVPSGVTVRNMILLVEATRVRDGRPLVFTKGQRVHALGGVGDPTRGYYAGLPGKLFAKVNHDANGDGPTFFTDATGIKFDSRIPAMAVDTSHYRFAIPGGTRQVQVRARLIYRRAFRALVDAKSWTTNGHGDPLEDLAPPHYGHLMEEVVETYSIRPALAR